MNVSKIGLKKIGLPHQAVNEQISILGQTVLCNLLKKIKATQPSWYSVIVDEATDVTNSEQLNLSIRWVNADYSASSLERPHFKKTANFDTQINLMMVKIEKKILI